MNSLIETHCHLDYLKQDDIDTVVNKSHQEGIEKIITIAVSPNNLDRVLEISQNYNQIYCSQGIHPHESIHFTQEVHDKIKKNSHQDKVVAIGEIGLDYHYNHSPKEKQKDVLRKQLEIACQRNLPVIIHSREAEEDTIAILSEFIGDLKKKGVIHSFTSKMNLAQFAIDNNFYLGFNGIITFKNAQDIQEIVKKISLKFILLETDAPYLTPVPHRGKENAPYYLPLVAKKIAELKKVDLELVIKTTYQNSCRLFQLV